jgi:uncharacterized protein (DUF1697 family)
MKSIRNQALLSIKAINLLFILITASLWSCHSQTEPMGETLATYQSEEPNSPAHKAEVPTQEGKQATAILSQRKIIRTGQISIEVADYEAARRALAEVVPRLHAFVAAENEEQNAWQQSNRLLIRVPAQHFDALNEEIRRLARRVDHRRVNSQDVTEEYVDIEARLNAKREAEKRYLSFLRNAKDVESMLAIQGAARQIREEIEAKEGRLRYLQDQVAYSSLEVFLYQEKEREEVVYQEDGFWTQLWEATAKGGEGVLAVFIGMAYLWPIWLVLGALVFMWLRRRRKP